VPAGARGDPGRKLREVGAGLDLALRSGLKAASAVSLQLSAFSLQLSAFSFYIYFARRVFWKVAVSTADP
jgi:hypothetical protein